MSSSLWRSAADKMRLELNRCAGIIDPCQPSCGLSELRVDGRALAGAALLGVELNDTDAHFAPARVEAYVRSGDLVATYSESPAPAMRAQIYWRAASHDPSDAIGAVELVTSVQTNSLDSCPRIPTRTRLHAKEAWQLESASQPTFAPVSLAARLDGAAESTSRPVAAPHCFLFRFVDGDFSYAEMVHPVDAGDSRCTLGAGGIISLEHQLFVERLEKGVILRARVLGVLLDRQDDMARAAAHYRAFASAALPLTT